MQAGQIVGGEGVVGRRTERGSLGRVGAVELAGLRPGPPDLIYQGAHPPVDQAVARYVAGWAVAGRADGFIEEGRRECATGGSLQVVGCGAGYSRPIKGRTQARDRDAVSRID